MCPTGIDLYDIAHVKVEFFWLQKIYRILRLGRFIRTTTFEQCDITAYFLSWYNPNVRGPYL